MSIIIRGAYEVDLEILQLTDQLTDERLYAVCEANPNLHIERDAKGNLIIMTPVGPESGYFEGELGFYLNQWNKKRKAGITFSPSTGFLLPNGAMRAPDASWIPLEKWKEVKARPQKGFPNICPDFVAEIRSQTDPLPKMQQKMKEWVENGARLAWLIDPWEEKAYIYRHDGSVQLVQGLDNWLSGEEVLEGFELELNVFRLP